MPTNTVWTILGVCLIVLVVLVILGTVPVRR